jgi:hypothetical protein
MLFNTQMKLAGIDKKITHALRESNFYKKNMRIDKYKISIKEIDYNELWIKEIERFINVALSETKYKKIFDSFLLTKADLVHFFVLMTIATMPNPIFKTGRNKMSNTLVGSAMYQELKKQLLYCLSTLGKNSTTEEQEQFSHRYASDVMIFASQLKYAHERAYGSINLEDVL